MAWSASIAAVVVVAGVAVAATQLDGHDTQAPAGKRSPTLTEPKPKGTRPLARVPGSLAGTWSGQVSQPGDIFTVTVSLAAGATSGTVQYSGSASCAGTLTTVSGSAGSLKLNQAITSGGCEPGVVELTAGPDGTMGFSYRGKSGPTAKGSLRKA